MDRTLIIIALLFSLEISSNAQLHPVHVKYPVYFSKTIPLADLKPISAEKFKSGPDEVIEFLEAPISEKFADQTYHFIDPLLQSEMVARDYQNILVNVEGVGNLQNKIPPDTEGDVGSNYYLQMINMSMAIFDKEGMMIFGPVANITLWQDAPGIWSEYSNGDPIVLYDEVAGRWLISELSFPYHPNGPYYEKIAVSESSNPAGSWYLYGYEYDYFCDYPKIGVWNDGYYMTTNNNEWVNSQWDFHAVGVSVFERDSMLAGSPLARRIFFDLYPNIEPWSVLPADVDGMSPPEGTPAYLAYYKEANPDRIGIFSVHTDWLQPENSMLELSQTLYPMNFNGNLPNGIPQPEGAPYLASLSNRLMYRLQYRNFGDYQTMVTNHTVNKGNGVAGIRWYEFRNYWDNWQIYQQGTYSTDNSCRWMGSAAMDGYGNIALGYSVSSTDTYPSIRYTGRLKDDAPGIMTLQETEIIAGSGVQLSPYHRWGDYSSMSVDPLDQTTFWYTQEYYEISGDKTWQTRIAAFTIIDLLALELSSETDSLCRGDSSQLYAMPAGGNGNYIFNWASTPSGFVSQEQNPVVKPEVTTVYYCNLNDGVNEAIDSLEIIVTENAFAYAGPDTSIIAGETFVTGNATAEYYSALEWAATGDGIFIDSSSLSATYLPGANDILLGETFLSLTASPLYSCNAATDTMRLEITSTAGVPTEEPEVFMAFIRPNPSDGNFELILGNQDPEKVTFTVRQMSGNVIYQEQFLANASQVKNISLDRPGPGIYIAEFRTSKINMVMKLIISVFSK